jgi:deoxycytidine triphosphate deaminase
MGVLTDTDLLEMLCTTKDWTDKHKIHIYPFADKSLTPIGYDLCVGSPCCHGTNGGIIDLRKGEKLKIRPRDTVLITTLETVGMPSDKSLSAFILSKVSQVAQGLTNISTTVDADYHGHLLITLHNASPTVISLEYGESFCTMVFLKNLTSATRDCGKKPDRPDILLKAYADATKRAHHKEKKKRIFLRLLQAVVIAAFAYTGWLRFGNAPGFVAMTALGVAITNTLLPIQRWS